jgi:hypothetical protein
VRRPNATSLTRGRGYQSHPFNSNLSVAGPRPARGPGRGRACAASVRCRRGCHARSGTGGAGEPGSQACTRSSPAPRPQPLRRLRRRTRSVRRTWARCGASSWGAEGEGPALHARERTARGRASSRPCMRRAQLVHAGRRPPCVRRLAPCMHSRTLTPCAACCAWGAAQRRGHIPAGRTARPP